MKKKPFKTIRSALVIIFVLVILVIIAAGLFADKALKMAIETEGTKALTVPVNIDKTALSFLQSSISLQNLMVDNPEDYQHKKLLELKQGDIKVDIKSLLSEVVNIEYIKLDGTKIVFEQRGVSGNNLQDLIKRLPPAKESSESGGKKLHIKKVEITNTDVQIKLLPIPGKIDTIPLKLSKIELTDLGSDNKLDMIALTREILLAIAEGIARQGTGIIPDEMLNSFVSELQKMEELSGVIFDSGKKVLETGTDIGKEVMNTGKEITEGIKGILQPTKKE